MFIEQLFLLWNDSNGRMSKLGIRWRLDNQLESLEKVRNYNQKSFIDNSTSERDLGSFELALNASCYVQSFLFAIELIDKYQNATHQQERDKIIQEIQNVFDGHQSVEDMLGRMEVGKDKKKQLAIIKKYL